MAQIIVIGAAEQEERQYLEAINYSTQNLFLAMILKNYHSEEANNNNRWLAQAVKMHCDRGAHQNNEIEQCWWHDI